MEDTLQRLASEAQKAGVTQVVRHSHEAIELLCDKISLMRSPMNEIRDKCFRAFGACLSAPEGNPKLIQLSIAGMQQMLRQDIYWTVDSDQYEHQLPSQLIDCLGSSIGAQSETTQLEMLSILQELSFSGSSLISLDTIEEIIEICCQLKGLSVKHRQAIQTTAGQSCHHFVKHCLNEPSDQFDTDEVVQLFHFLSQELDKDQSQDAIGVLLKCVHYSLLTIPSDRTIINEKFHDIIWQTLIPSIIKIVTPIEPNNQKKGHDSAGDGKQSGREVSQQWHTSDHKTVIFKIAAELLRLSATISSLRPSLESLFHRLLLCPPVSHRLEAIKWLEEVLKNVDLLVRTSVEPQQLFGKSSLSKDLDLLHIAMDSLEECSQSSETQISVQSISSVVTFLRSLQTICNSDVPQTFADIINRLYPNLIDADFEGFKVRQTAGQTFKANEPLELQRKVSIKTLKQRIVGFNDNEQTVQTGHEESEPKPKKPECDKNMRDFKVEAYKSKLKEIMDSRSTDSAENDGHNESELSVTEANGLTDNERQEELDEHWTARENTDSSLTEGPEYEDCVEQMAAKNEYRSSSEDTINDSDGIHEERDNARRFLSSLKTFLPKLLSLRTCVEADQEMQTFASNYCTELLEWQKSNSKTNSLDHNHLTIINADGIYLSTYSALLLNLKLMQTNFYNNSSSIPMTEREFIEDIQNSGILVYVSCYWLAELYQSVLADNLLVSAGYDPTLDSNVALINLLIDLDGLNNCRPGGQQLSDYRRLEKTASPGLYHNVSELKASHKLVRRVITAFWDTIIGCLGTAFKVDHNTGQLISNAFIALMGKDNKDSTKREMIILSLEGLQIAAKLCIQLGLQPRCDKIFELLTLSVDQSDIQLKAELYDLKNRPMGRSILEAIRSRCATGLHTSSVMSVQVLLSCSLEVGSHCPVCWRYVFKCCQHIMELEHCYFTSRHSSLLSSTRTSLVSLIRPGNRQTTDYEMAPVDTISMPGINEVQEFDSLSTIDKLVSESVTNATDSVLKDKPLERVIEVLSHLVDLLFEDAANKLNLRCLHNFVTELCMCSAEQLNLIDKCEANTYSPKSLLLFRLSDVMLRCAKSGRPLLHFMKCWSVVASHLVEAVGHSDQSVSRKSVSTLHDIINAILCSHNELPHFHFNEALFKPFESLLLQEMCDLDIQELIISSICEFVEGTTEEIRSGWRSLFGALRGIRFPDSGDELSVERNRQLRIILDIFEAFLHTHNLQVFANASVDCLLCLLKLIKSPNSSSDSDETSDLCMISLRYLDQMTSMLLSMYQMPGCPIFSNIRLSNSCINTKFIDISRLPNNCDIRLEAEVSLKELDRSVRILEVCFLLVDELAETLDKCHSRHRITAVDMLFNWLRAFIESPGPRFGIYCANHILMPSLQRITRQTLDSSGDHLLPTLRHMFGATADLVVTYFQLTDGPDLQGIELLLRQTLLVYIECLNGEYKESIAKLSGACIRHILLEVRHRFHTSLWQTTVQCLSIAHRLTLDSLDTLVNSFQSRGANFFDDLDQIQVISRRDPNEDSEQLCRLAQQIFLLDVQRSHCRSSLSEHRQYPTGCAPIAENRSFVLLIKSYEQKLLTVSFRVLIVQLTCHWLLLQTISSLIVIGIDPIMPNLSAYTESPAAPSEPSLLMMNVEQRNAVINLLDASYRIAFDFDSKPGLKFLMQKISRSEMPSNLYQISSLVWSLRVVVDVFLVGRAVADSDTDLSRCLTDLCDRYCQLVCSTECNEPSIDNISHQSLHLIQTSHQELMDIIGKKSSAADTDDINNDDDSEHEDSNESDEELVDSKQDIKVYNLVTQDKIDSMVTEYKKYKTQWSATPGQRSTTDRPEANSESTQFLIKDSQASKGVCSEILKQSLDLVLSLPEERFRRLVPIFLPTIQSLTVDCNNKEVRSRVSQWIARIAHNFGQ